MPLVDDNRRHRANPRLLEEVFGLAHLVGILARLQHALGFGRIQPDLPGHAHQQLARARVFAVGEIRFEQREFERVLATLLFRPVQEAVGVEGVVDAAAARHVELEADRFAALADLFARLDLLLERGTILLGDVLDDVLALGTHVRVQLEGLEMQVDGDIRRHALDGLLQRLEADRAPRARHVRYEINPQLLAHATPPS